MKPTAEAVRLRRTGARSHLARSIRVVSIAALGGAAGAQTMTEISFWHAQEGKNREVIEELVQRVDRSRAEVGGRAVFGTGKKAAREGLDAAVHRGNAILREFGVTRGAAASGEICEPNEARTQGRLRRGRSCCPCSLRAPEILVKRLR